MDSFSGLRFVEYFAIFTIVGLLSYKFVRNIQIIFSNYNPINELVLMIMWCLIWMGVSSLIRRLLKKVLVEEKV